MAEKFSGFLSKKYSGVFPGVYSSQFSRIFLRGIDGRKTYGNLLTHLKLWARTNLPSLDIKNCINYSSDTAIPCCWKSIKCWLQSRKLLSANIENDHGIGADVGPTNLQVWGHLDPGLHTWRLETALGPTVPLTPAWSSSDLWFAGGILGVFDVITLPTIR